jgi:hypothetical protein
VEALLEVVLFTLNYYQRRKEVRTGVLRGLLSNQVHFEELFANILWAETTDYKKIMDFFNNILIALSLSRRKRRRMWLHTALSSLHPWLPTPFFVLS